MPSPLLTKIITSGQTPPEKLLAKVGMAYLGRHTSFMLHPGNEALGPTSRHYLYTGGTWKPYNATDWTFSESFGAIKAIVFVGFGSTTTAVKLTAASGDEARIDTTTGFVRATTKLAGVADASAVGTEIADDAIFAAALSMNATGVTLHVNGTKYTDTATGLPGSFNSMVLEREWDDSNSLVLLLDRELTDAEAAAISALAFAYQIQPLYSMPGPNYTSWLSLDQPIVRNDDSFGGPGVWDPATSLYRLYSNWNLAVTGRKIHMYTSADNRTWNYVGIALDLGTAGQFDDESVGVPFAWYESGETRPWRMVYRGSKAGVGSLGMATSLDGITWERKDVAGTDLTSAIVAFGSNDIDLGNVFKDAGTYYLHFNTITASARKIYLATSTDLLSWTIRGGGTPEAIFYGCTDGAGGWDYRDKDRTETATDNGFGLFCGWFGYHIKPNGVKEYLAYIPSYREKSGSNGIRSGITVWSSTSPLFLVANRTFRGWLWSTLTATPGTFGGSAIASSGLDVPRVCAGIGQRLDNAAPLVLSVVSDAYSWSTGIMVRPANLPVAQEAADVAGAVLSGVTGAFPVQSPGLQLDFSPGNQLVFNFASSYGMRDLGGCGLHPQPNAGVTQAADKITLARASDGKLRYLPSAIPANFGAQMDTYTLEMKISKSAVLGAGGYGAIFQVGSDTDNLYPRLYLNGSVGDTAVSLTFKITNPAGLGCSFDTAAFDWSGTDPIHIAFCKANGKIYWFKDGVLQNAGGTAFDNSIRAIPNAANARFAIGDALSMSSVPWPGSIYWLRLTNSALWTAGFTPAAPALAYQTTGYVYSGVYDFTTAKSIAPQLDTTLPTGCAVETMVRAASSAADRSVTYTDFTASAAASRFQQFALKLTGPGTTTPKVNRIRVTAR